VQDYQDYPPPPGAGPPSAGLSIASLVLGIISVVTFCFWIVGVPCAILAIIFGFIGRTQGGQGMAVAGLVLGFVSLGLLFLVIAGIIASGDRIIQFNR
jgi:hypothetical protein